jgi:hypothetical protein
MTKAQAYANMFGIEQFLNRNAPTSARMAKAMEGGGTLAEDYQLLKQKVFGRKEDQSLIEKDTAEAFNNFAQSMYQTHKQAAREAASDYIDEAGMYGITPGTIDRWYNLAGARGGAAPATETPETPQRTPAGAGTPATAMTWEQAKQRAPNAVQYTGPGFVWPTDKPVFVNGALKYPPAKPRP